MTTDTRFDPITSLEGYLGDPLSNHGKLSQEGAIRYDELCTNPNSEIKALNQWALHHYLVPYDLGGALRDLDVMMLLFRSVFRRDPAIGFTYAMTPFMAALPIWCGGNQEQKKETAAHILNEQTICVVLPGDSRNGDTSSDRFTVLERDDAYCLGGAASTIHNANRSAAFVFFAIRAEQPTADEYSIFLVDRALFHDAESMSIKRMSLTGIRACSFSDIKADGISLPKSARIGAPGSGLATLAQASHVSRVVFPGMMVGVVESAIRCVVEFLDQRLLYRMYATELPLVKAQLAELQSKVWIADAVTLAATRCAHIMPAHFPLVSAVTGFFVTKLLEDSLHTASVLLGARHYLRTGDYSHFQKLLRDFEVASIAYHDASACLESVSSGVQRAAESWMIASSDHTLDETLSTKLNELFRFERPLSIFSWIKTEADDSLEEMFFRPLPGILKWLQQDLTKVDNESAGPIRKVVALMETVAERHHKLMSHLFYHCRDICGARSIQSYLEEYCRLYSSVCCFYTWYFNRDASHKSMSRIEWIISALELLADPDHVPDRENDQYMSARLLQACQQNKALSLIGI